MSMWRNTSQSNYTQIPVWGGNIVGTTLIALTVVSVTGNLAVILLLGKSRHTRRVHLFQINLAICELLSAVLTYCMTAAGAFLRYWPFGTTGCYYYGFTSGWLALNSITCLMAVSIERYVVISRPFLERRLTIQVKMTFALVTWIYSFILAVPPLFGISRYTLEGYRISCCFDYISRDNVSRSYLFYLFWGGFILPVSTIGYCYTKIYLHVRHSRQFANNMHIGNMERSHLRSAESEANNNASKSSSSTSTQANQPAIQSLIDPTNVSSNINDNFTNSSSGKTRNQSENSATKQTRPAYQEIKLSKLIILVTIVFIISWVPYSVMSLTAQFGPEGIISPTVMLITNLMAKFSVVYNPFIYWWKDGSFRRNAKKTLLCRSVATRSRSRSDV